MTMKHPAATPIEYLRLPDRYYRRLLQLGIETVEHLLTVEVRILPGLGEKAHQAIHESLKNLPEILAKNGISPANQ